MKKLLTGDDLDMDKLETGVEPTSYEEKIAHWDTGYGEQIDSADEEEEEILSELPDFSSYADILTISGAYQRLISRIKTEILLEVPEPDIICTVKAGIISGLSLSSTRHLHARNSCTATYVLDWAPMSFYSEQGYTEPPDSAIAHAIVLIGTERAAQVTTCEEYMRQTWPMTGEKTLQALKIALRSKTEDSPCKEKRMVTIG